MSCINSSNAHQMQTAIASPANNQVNSDQNMTTGLPIDSQGNNWRALAQKMGGSDSFAITAGNFKPAPFTVDDDARMAFTKKLGETGHYKDITSKNGEGSGIAWTQELADSNLDTLSQSLEQLDQRGLLEDGKLSLNDVKILALDAPDVPNSSQGSIQAPQQSQQSQQSVPQQSVPQQPVQAPTPTPSNTPASPSIFGGPITSADQTPGGKQSNLPGTKPNQNIHRTGLSRYETNGDVESFQVKAGGFLVGSSKSPRAEAFFRGDTTNKSFSADYQVYGSDQGPTTIFQQFGKNGPSIRIEFDKGQISVANVDNSPDDIAKVQDGEQFSLQVQDLGNQTARISITDSAGKQLGSDVFSNNRNGENPSNRQFRYGAYYGGQNEVQVLVRNVETTI